MAVGHINEVVGHLRRAVLLHDGAGLTDGQLLACFLDQREEAALAALVRRHGPLVWSICRRVLGNHHDAEDAFQATFLVLVRRAASVSPREQVANWLYGVACRTAYKARTVLAKQKSRERLTEQIPEPSVREAEGDNDRQYMLHQALGHLPQKYRVALILCDLEGQTRKEAARQLEVPEGTVAAWLARGRALLTKRLARQGLALAGGALALELASCVASASVPPTVESATLQAVALVAGEPSLNVVSPSVVYLMEAVMNGMLVSKVKMTTTILLAVVAAAGLGSGGLAYRMQAAEEAHMVPSAEQAAAAIDPAPQSEEAPAIADENCDDEDRLIGSGKEGKKEIKVADFDALDIRLPLHVSASRGDTFSVVLTGDDNLLDIIKADKDGSTLRFTAQRRSWQTKKPLQATITMPALVQIRLDSASRLTIKDFKSSKDFSGKLSGASSVEGALETGDIKLDVNAASTLKLKGSAKNGTLKANGASRLVLADFTLDAADIHLNGACTATVNVKSKLDYALSGACKLNYSGNPTVGKKQSTGASSVSHK